MSVRAETNRAPVDAAARPIADARRSGKTLTGVNEMNVIEREDWPSAWSSGARRPRGDGDDKNGGGRGEEALGPAPILAGLAALFAVGTFAVAVLSGCAADGAFERAVDGYAEAILPEYRAYVAEDEGLSEASKRIRLQTADRFEALIDAALESAVDEASDAHHDEGGERTW
jgi:hypothetical protein